SAASVAALLASGSASTRTGPASSDNAVPWPSANSNARRESRTGFMGHILGNGAPIVAPEDGISRALLARCWNVAPICPLCRGHFTGITCALLEWCAHGPRQMVFRVGTTCALL